MYWHGWLAPGKPDITFNRGLVYHISPWLSSVFLAELVGIRVQVTEESYTSKANLLDLDPLPVRNNGDERHTFSGKRIKRGLYRASDGSTINANLELYPTPRNGAVPTKTGSG